MLWLIFFGIFGQPTFAKCPDGYWGPNCFYLCGECGRDGQQGWSCGETV